MNTPPRKNSSTLVHSLAKVFDSNAIQSQGPPVITGPSRRFSDNNRNTSGDAFNVMDVKLESLSQTVDKLLGIQEKVIQKLDGITQDVDKIGQKVEMLSTDKEEMKKLTSRKEDENKNANVSVDISDMLSMLNNSSKEQTKKIDRIENVLLGVQQVISYLGETFKNSKIAEFILKGQFTSRQRGTAGSDQQTFKKRITSEKLVLRRRKEKVKDQRSGDVKGKQNSNVKEIKSHQKKKPPDSTEPSTQKDLDIFGDQKIQNSNQENVSNSSAFEDQDNVKDPAEHNNITKLQGESFEEDVGVFEPQPSRLTKGTSSAIVPEFAEAILDIYVSDEKKKDVAIKEQSVIKPGETLTTVKNQSSINGKNDKRTEKNVMHEKIRDNRILEKLQEKENDVKVDKDLTTEPASEGGKEELIGEENKETEKIDVKIDESNEVVEDTSLESRDSELTITEGSKEKVIASQVEESEDQHTVCHGKNCTVLLNRYEDSEREAEALLAAAAEPEEGTSQNAEQHEVKDLSTANKRRVTGEDSLKDDNKKSRVEEKGQSQESTSEPTSCQSSTTSNASQKENNQETKEQNPHIVIDDGPAPPAPFEHRIVSANMAQISKYYTIDKSEILGGGRFGQVHKCVEKSTGLTLAAKIIKTRIAKQKEEVKNEIQVMNQLNHTNLIQLYDAFESKNDIILVMEYIDGGELFDRIIDESYNLTEMDTILFVRQICEGLQYMHQRYILHLDLKPENILCVNREANQVKIIDFGLARRYKPREKLKIHFGTPEFLAPEVVNYDFVSFPTDMWSLGVITYMLLSGLSPFLGEDDNETLNNIIACEWDLNDAEFENVSEDAKEFISKLLIKEKGARISATQCLKQPWLNNIAEKAKQCKVRLKSQILLQKYMVRRLWKKNYYAVTAANRLKKLNSGTLASTEV
ncbi:myosin light chain kinase 3 isoform X1 [Carcharodon carcharias]|uniref:myosin light chain kinase 3 isoform X1 n=2 Tax=Carcharodon carcharias TaxID=13397 RepID=UPI001B7F054C|nr:myosin light chain kinase 3 isoform X1 [Carcharodon carcharias]